MIKKRLLCVLWSVVVLSISLGPEPRGTGDDPVRHALPELRVGRSRSPRGRAFPPESGIARKKENDKCAEKWYRY